MSRALYSESSNQMRSLKCGAITLLCTITAQSAHWVRNVIYYHAFKCRHNICKFSYSHGFWLIGIIESYCYSLKIATIYNGGLIITSLLEWWHESLVSATTLQSSWFHFIKGNPTINILINEFCTSFLSSCNLFKALKSSDSMKKCHWLFFWKQIIFFGQLFDSTIWSVTSQSDFSLWGIIQLHLRSLQKGPP